jgi:hypothetical protein
MATFYERYINGEHAAVWAELTELGEAVREEPLCADAQAVAHETMRRVRWNIEILIRRLASHDYRFGLYPDQTPIPGYRGPLGQPPASITERIEYLTALEDVKAIPLSLESFWKVVGEVNLAGYHPGWPAYSDPLWVEPVEAAIREYADWEYSLQQGLLEEDFFGVPLAPDAYHKDNVSGGDPYQILVPNADMDAVLEFERHEILFVDYLRLCFRCGGFPGLEGHLPAAVLQLAEGLEPF